MADGVTLEQLRTLRAVAEAGSFSAAARKLGRVQAAVSQSIERLENELGLLLFDRSRRLPRLTEQGHAVVAAARRVEDGMNGLDELATRLKQGRETRLAIVVDAMFPTASLVTFGHDFAASHPDVELSLFTDLLSGVTSEVQEQRATWGIALEDADMTDLERRPIAELRLVPVVAPAHPLASVEGPVDAERLASAVQIVQSEHDRASRSRGVAQGVFSSKRWGVVDLATKHALIRAGLGFGHMPEHVVRADLDAGRLVQLELAAWGGAPLKRAFVLVWRRGTVLGPVAKAAAERLCTLCRREITTD